LGYTVNFTDNQNVTADDLNSVAYGLTEDSTSFSDGTLYGVKDLNAISKSIITKGVSSGCNVSLKSGKVFISQGTAYFDDGKKITIDADGITLSRQSTTQKNYVWLSNDDITGQVSAKCTKSSPSGDFVKLAEISSSGVVTKTKDIAKMKNPSLLPNFYPEPITIKVKEDKTWPTIQTKIDIGADYKRMVAISYYNLIYLDWENMTGYRQTGDDRIETYDLSDSSKRIYLALAPGVYVEFISYKNNILTTNITHGISSPSFTIYCM